MLMRFAGTGNQHWHVGFVKISTVSLTLGHLGMSRALRKMVRRAYTAQEKGPAVDTCY